AGQVQVLLPVRTNDDPVGFTSSCETGSSCQETPQPTNLLLVTSPDAGVHWTPPFQVNSNASSNFFPWIVAGSGGMIDADYYTTSSQRPNDPDSRWSIDFSQITGATATVSGGAARYAKRPRVVTVPLDSKAVH